MRNLLAALLMLAAGISSASAQVVQFSSPVTLGANTFGGNQAVCQNTCLGAPDAPLYISNNTLATPAPASGTLAHLVGADGADAALAMDNFGTGIPRINVRTTAGTSASPAWPANGATLFSIGGRPCGTSSACAAANRWAINVTAGEAQDATHQGNSFTFRCTPVGGILTSTCATLDGSGNFVAVGNITTNGTSIAGNNSGTFSLLNSPATSTQPTLLPNATAATTGIGAQAAGNISMIVAGTETARFAANGETKLGYVQLGAISAYTGLQAGDLAMTYHSDVATAPGAGGCYMAWVPATITGRKLIARCNTSTTAVTVVDNVGN